MRKIVFLHKRSSGRDLSEFQSQLLASCQDDADIPGLARYVQSHTLPQGYRKGEVIFDAVEEFGFAEEALADYFAAGPIYAEIRMHRAALIDPARSCVLAVDAHRVKSRPVPVGALKSIELVSRCPGMALGEFRRYWREVHGPIGSRIPSMLRYEQNHTALSSYRDGRTPPYDGLAITWFASSAAMREGALTEAYEATRADEQMFLPDGHLPLIITREVAER